jgi:hypothetical protein
MEAAELTAASRPGDATPWQLEHRRLAEVITAIWEHERRTRELTTGARPHDTALYRRLRRVLGGTEAKRS